MKCLLLLAYNTSALKVNLLQYHVFVSTLEPHMFIVKTYE